MEIVLVFTQNLQFLLSYQRKLERCGQPNHDERFYCWPRTPFSDTLKKGFQDEGKDWYYSYLPCHWQFAQQNVEYRNR